VCFFFFGRLVISCRTLTFVFVACFAISAGCFVLFFGLWFHARNYVKYEPLT
jgi:hypothetical protein